MRVTSNTLRMAFLTALDSAQQRLLKTQTQISTGKRVNAPSDDPFAAARIGEIDAALSRLSQLHENGVVATNRLGLEETVLADVVSNLQRVRELALQANSSTLGNAEREGIAAELRERFDSLVSLANSVDGSGRHLFAGYSEDARPFVVGPSGVVTYNGDDGQRFVQINDERLVAVSDSGAAVFQRIASGNGTFSLAADPGNTGTAVLGAGSVADMTAYVRDSYMIEFITPSSYEVRDGGGALVASGAAYEPGQAIEFLGVSVELSGAPAAGDRFDVTPSLNQDVFTTLDTLISQLETPVNDEASRALLHSGVGQSLVDLDRAIEHMTEVRAEVGARLRAVDDEALSNEDFSLQMTKALSELRDLDYPEALSLLTQQLFQLDAAQQAFARTQNLSLFRFL